MTRPHRKDTTHGRAMESQAQGPGGQRQGPAVRQARERNHDRRPQRADPASNARLRLVVEQARKVSMPKDTLERAIKKGAGLTGESVHFDHVIYEGFAPHRVPVMVECLTDNVNRTAPEMRVLFRKGQLGASGSVAWDFDHLGMIEAEARQAGADPELAAIEAGAQDFEPRRGGRHRVPDQSGGPRPGQPRAAGPGLPRCARRRLQGQADRSARALSTGELEASAAKPLPRPPSMRTTSAERVRGAGGVARDCRQAWRTGPGVMREGEADWGRLVDTPPPSRQDGISQAPPGCASSARARPECAQSCERHVPPHACTLRLEARGQQSAQGLKYPGERRNRRDENACVAPIARAAPRPGQARGRLPPASVVPSPS